MVGAGPVLRSLATQPRAPSELAEGLSYELAVGSGPEVGLLALLCATATDCLEDAGTHFPNGSEHGAQLAYS